MSDVREKLEEKFAKAQLPKKKHTKKSKSHKGGGGPVRTRKYPVPTVKEGDIVRFDAKSYADLDAFVDNFNSKSMQYTLRPRSVVCLKPQDVKGAFVVVSKADKMTVTDQEFEDFAVL